MADTETTLPAHLQAVKQAWLDDPSTLRLYSGSHKPPGDGQECRVCIEEAVALFADLPWTDRPEHEKYRRQAGVSPVIATFLRVWQDGMDDDDRNNVLIPADDPFRYIAGQLGTFRGAAVETRRAWMCTDWAVRVSLPAWLRLAGIEAHAATLAALPEIVDEGTLEPAKALIREAGAAAREAAGAAGAAAGAAAWEARKTLRPVVVELQASALDLVDRMIDEGRQAA